MVYYPSFLKNEPLIWGISLSDIMKLTFCMFFMSLMDFSQEVILVFLFIIYGSLIFIRRRYQRHYFSFLMKRKKELKSFGLIRLKRKESLCV
jgi:hypothetical protein